MTAEAAKLIETCDNNDAHHDDDDDNSRKKKKKNDIRVKPDGIHRNTQLYPYSINQLTCLVDPINAYVLQQFGGINQLAENLHTNLATGLTTNTDNTERVKAYGENILPARKSKSLLQLMWIALTDKVLIILSVAAIVSLAMGLYETFGQPPEFDAEGRKLPKVEWVEGVAILVAILIVVLVGALNDWQKEKQLLRLNQKKEDRKVRVIRDGNPGEISVFNVLVGDLVIVEPGEMIPTDGILIRGYDVQCDESSVTGESDTKKKRVASTVLENIKTDPSIDPSNKHADCFMLSGAKVLGGTGVYLVTAVGKNSIHGKTMLSLSGDAEATPLQEKLNYIAEMIAKIGILAAAVLFVVLFIRFLVQLKDSIQTSAEKGTAFISIFIIAVTIVVIAVPEGLPLAVTLALAFATTRMVKDNNLVRVLKSCETMGGATTVCSDKTGTLTQNKMSVVAGVIGSHDTAEGSNRFEISSDGDSSTVATLVNSLPDKQRELILKSIAVNSSAFESNDENATEQYIGSKTETALLNFAREYLNLGGLEQYRQSQSIVQIFPFDSAKKYMASIIKENEDGGDLLLMKGASEIILKKCTEIYDCASGRVRKLGDQDVEQLQQTINEFASNSLRTMSLACRSVSSTSEDEFKDLTFLSLFGIMDPLRPGVRQAVLDCQKAGVVVRMVTGDNINTARAIAIDCGILLGPDDDHVVIEGPEFRKLDVFQQRKVVPKLRVMARSSPQDKRQLVKILKSQGETVAVTGDGTNDAPALKLADVGFSMGIAGTEVAKEASEIILMDDNFASIVKAMMWGRTVNDAVKKFLQFQLTVNVTAVVLTFVSAVANSSNQSVLTAVQLLWVNLIMDTLAALALATDPPVRSVLDRKPDSRSSPLITVKMWKMILGQSVLQLIITFVLHFTASSIWNVADSDSHGQEQLNAMIFNTFVWLQFFNIFVNRRLDSKLNIFEGILKNKFFIAIALVIGGGQILIMFVGGAAFSIVRQTGAQWAVAIICGLLSLPMGLLIRLIPDSWAVAIYPERLVRFISRHVFRRKRPAISVEDEESQAPRQKWNPAIEQVRDQLVFLKKVRGGRLSQLKFRPKQLYESWKESMSPSPSTIPSEGTSHYSYSPTLTPSIGPHHTDSNNTSNYFNINNTNEVSTHGGFLAVPTSMSPGRNRAPSSSGSSIGALTMVPGLIGGAIGGSSWYGDSSEDERDN